jgi:hypothetical protein
MKRILCLTLLVLMALAMIPVQAMNITMANPSGIAQRDILVYDSAGQLYGLYNSTSTISINGTEDYVFSMKPMQTNPMEDPADWLTNNSIPFVTSNVTYIIIMIVLAALWFGRK